ncbi:hypothetical protein QQF64_004328 [Cirrhinus molitorella]|uniref:Uncharacterized protein n=1 Tax=Cirrhinus molitorella TaxID=172907 RepID=A0ABR3MJS2_9TELE
MTPVVPTDAGGLAITRGGGGTRESGRKISRWDRIIQISVRDWQRRQGFKGGDLGENCICIYLVYNVVWYLALDLGRACWVSRAHRLRGRYLYATL